MKKIVSMAMGLLVMAGFAMGQAKQADSPQASNSIPLFHPRTAVFQLKLCTWPRQATIILHSMPVPGQTCSVLSSMMWR